ncbi:hypothetical protein IPJ70_03925 [Candidatus Campbellbacteria bacterium]|nr:MAG: hypothetical protein IPJ70_03925 [Candidatus Campbellbacteria bacterium]
MKTFRDVRKVGSEAVLSLRLFGGEEDFQVAIREKLREIGVAICEENGLPLSMGPTIPDDTVLGDRSGPLFEELEAMIEADRQLDEEAINSGLS